MMAAAVFGLLRNRETLTNRCPERLQDEQPSVTNRGRTPTARVAKIRISGNKNAWILDTDRNIFIDCLSKYCYKMVVIRVEERDARKLKMYGKTYAEGVRNLLDFRENKSDLLDQIKSIVRDEVDNVIGKYAG
jgi:hypothetical protein